MLAAVRKWRMEKSKTIAPTLAEPVHSVHACRYQWAAARIARGVASARTCARAARWRAAAHSAERARATPPKGRNALLDDACDAPARTLSYAARMMRHSVTLKAPAEAPAATLGAAKSFTRLAAAARRARRAAVTCLPVAPHRYLFHRARRTHAPPQRALLLPPRRAPTIDASASQSAPRVPRVRSARARAVLRAAVRGGGGCGGVPHARAAFGGTCTCKDSDGGRMRALTV
eukprot:IDg17010t1